MKSAILLIHCPDQKGIVATVSNFLFTNQGNIIDLEQHVDFEAEIFFMRVEWELTNFLIPANKIQDYFQTLIAEKFNMEFQLHFSENIPRMAIFVSKQSHCLIDLLGRATSKEWNVHIPVIISNHRDLEFIAKQYNIEFHLFEITPENKEAQEAKQILLLQDYKIDTIVLARYMQVLTDKIISVYTNRIINIHHSFLPAFPGAKPYHQAHEKGVKIIGATSHYVTTDLDVGPIIDQDVAKISHKESIPDLVRKGKDIEKLVLSRAVWNHLQNRILVYGNRTIVFS